MRNNEFRRGSALVETAILLPIYCLLTVGSLYFAGIGLLQQELPMLARYAAEVPGAEMPAASPGITIPMTSGPALADGQFALWNGDPLSQIDRETPLTAGQAREEMVKISFRAGRQTTFDADTGDIDQETEIALSREGNVLFGLGVLYYDADDHIVLAIGDEIAEEFSRWFQRRGVSISTGHDAAIYQGNWGPTAAWSLAGLPVPALVARVFGVTRAVGADPGSTLTRELGHSYAGEHPAAYLFTQYWDGSYPVAGYPDYGASSDFWTRN